MDLNNKTADVLQSQLYVGKVIPSIFLALVDANALFYILLQLAFGDSKML